MTKKFAVHYYFTGCVLLYLLITLWTPVDPKAIHQYHLTTTQVHLLSVGIIVPVLLIWCLALYAYKRLTDYSSLISNHKDGKLIRLVGQGVGVLALGSPTTAVINSFMTFLSRHRASLLTPSLIITNYFTLIIPLLAFIIIGMAARRLTSNTKYRLSQTMTNALLIAFTCLSVAYCYFIFSNQHITTVYKLPLSILALTVVVPYIFTWFTGMLAVTDLLIYSAKAQGLLYRKGWQFLAYGLGLVILSSIAIQYTTTLTERLSKLHVGWLLGIIYLLILLIASGYVLIARGSNYLKKMEEV